MRIKQTLLLSCVAVAVCGVAHAQSSPTKSPAPVAPTASTGCAPSQAAPNQGSIAPSETTAQNREPLGDKLARSDGVLCPPAGVDPEIRAPTPETGNTPVIRPPGSPGGDQSLRPK